ncbi:MAG: vWA domain-containing protein [Patescibacteria group bacterium]
MSDIVRRPESKEALLAKIESLVGIQKPGQNFSSPAATKSSNLLQITFLFDTTGSMYHYFERGKKSIAKIVRKVAEKHSNAKFCYVAYKNHGDEDYFGGTNPFFATSFSSLPAQLESELQKVKNGGGGDGLTALECVFHYLNTRTSWLPTAAKTVVLIGDMPPHGVLDSISCCPRENNYKAEVEEFKRKGIKVYSVFCFEEGELGSRRKQKVQEFFKWIAKETGGRYLELSEIDEVVDLLTAICMKETGNLESFIAELRSIGRLRPGSNKEKTLLALGDGRK